jgi:hypothetical protein
VTANVFSFKYHRPVYIYEYDIQLQVALTSKLAVTITLVTCSREVAEANLRMETDYPE